jgi:class 3 adenylate cyclase
MTETTTVTVLFTDVVGSVSMRQSRGETTAHEIMGTHNDLERQQPGQYAGREVKTTGDGFMVAFDSARKAVDRAIGIRRALLDHNRKTPNNPVKVRIGPHTGEAVLEGDDLFQNAVHAAIVD